MGGRPPREVGACTPLAESHEGGGGASAWVGRGSTDACHRGAWEYCSGDTGRRHGVRRALEKEKA
jgi:hypothetical protein